MNVYLVPAEGGVELIGHCRLPFRSAHAGPDLVVSIGDVQDPFARRRYCLHHAPAHDTGCPVLCVLVYPGQDPGHLPDWRPLPGA